VCAEPVHGCSPGLAQHLALRIWPSFVAHRCSVRFDETGFAVPPRIAPREEEQRSRGQTTVGRRSEGETLWDPPPQVGLIDRLNRIVPEGLDSFFFTNSGSEVVDNAIKLARAATGRPNIICFEVRQLPARLRL